MTTGFITALFTKRHSAGYLLCCSGVGDLRNKQELTSSLWRKEDVSICGLQFHNVDGAGTFGTLLDIKADSLTLDE